MGVTSLGVWQVLPNITILASGSYTSEAVDLANANALALHVTAISGAAPSVTFTYSLSNTKAGTYVTPSSPATIGANIGAVDVLDFAPELARFIKIIATNNNGAAPVTLTAALAIQEI